MRGNKGKTSVCDKERNERQKIIEAAFRTQADLNAVLDIQFRYLAFSDTYKQEFKRIFGKDIEVGTSVAEILADLPDDRENALELWRRVIKGERFSIVQEFGDPTRGTYSCFEFRFCPVYDEQGRMIGIAQNGMNITDRVQAEQALQQSEKKYHDLFTKMLDGFAYGEIVADEQGRPVDFIYREVNAQFERNTGLRRENVINRKVTEVMPGIKNEPFDWIGEYGKVALEGKELHTEQYTREFDHWLSLTAYSPQKGFFVAVVRDITEQKRAIDRIRYISFHDELTGLYNRAFFEEELRRVDTERELPVSIISGDVNNLKLTNDVFGHAEGDKLLRVIADSIKKACRQSDIVARWGGDEFAVILPKTSLSVAEEICVRIGQIARTSKGTVLQPSIAIGVAAKEYRHQNIYHVIRQAEKRMYDNKRAQAAANREMTLDTLLQQVLEKAPDYSDHIARSCELADSFGKELGLSEDQQRDLRLLIELHDVGEATVPAEILAKQGELNVREWEIMKKHVEAGFQVVKTYADTARISDEVLAHAECWDGSGYPRGLKGKEIPYLVRIFRIIDTFDAMTHSRPYARTFTPEDAIEELRNCAGKQFDPELVERFVALISARTAVVS